MSAEIFIATLESPSFTFDAFGRSEKQAKRALVKELNRHAGQYDLAADWFSHDDINVRRVRFDEGYRR